MNGHRPRRHAARSGPLGAFVFVLALLAAQAVGLVHRVAHAPGIAAAAAAVSDAGRQQADRDGADRPGPGHVGGSPECRLFDQAAHGDALQAAPPGTALPHAQPPRCLASPGFLIAAHHAPHRARGPPAVG